MRVGLRSSEERVRLTMSTTEESLELALLFEYIHIIYYYYVEKKVYRDDVTITLVCAPRLNT